MRIRIIAHDDLVHRQRTAVFESPLIGLGQLAGIAQFFRGQSCK